MSQKRSIFEEVGETSRPAEAPKGGLIARGQGARRAIRLWLMSLFALVAGMIVVGGLTRLTGSGLSITEWAPMTGAIPPMSGADWQAEFERYRAIPQYELVNRGMSLEEFKVIYWWEWGHRQLGRLVGLVWAVGFCGFLIARKIPAGWTPRLLALGALGGLQGAIGWWMVASGLEDGMIAVASYRLAVHLGLAFVILGLLAWYIMAMGRSAADLMQARRAREGRLSGLTTFWMYFAFLQIVTGALVAGIEAGRAFPEWPLMAGQIVPPNAFDLEPVWRNLFENPGLTQFIHRTLGYLLVVFGLVVWWRGRASAHAGTRTAFHLAGAALVAQLVLGIATVIHAAPWQLAIAHQGLAIVLFVLIIRARFVAQFPPAQTLRA